MTIDDEKIKDAIDKFENDEYVESKEIIQQEIRKAKDAYLKDKLGLKGNDGEQEQNTEED